MMKFTNPETYQGQVDPRNGFLCLVTYWRPTEGESEVEGEKLSTSIFLSLKPGEPCLCGSGKMFGQCCQPRRFWQPLCPNPGIPEKAGYSLTAPQTATFQSVAGEALRAVLGVDLRFKQTEDTLARAFWIYHGAPVIETPYGWLCWGDVELVQNHTLVVTAMSDQRMEILLKVVQSLPGIELGQPRLQREPIYGLDKRTGKMMTVRP